MLRHVHDHNLIALSGQESGACCARKGYYGSALDSLRSQAPSFAISIFLEDTIRGNTINKADATAAEMKRRVSSRIFRRIIIRTHTSEGYDTVIECKCRQGAERLIAMARCCCAA